MKTQVENVIAKLLTESQNELKTYLNKIENGELKIENEQELKELDLNLILHLKTLTIENCSNIQKLQSKSVSKLLIIGAFQSLEDFQLENLEDLTLINIEEQNRILIKEMNKFTKLKEIYIYGWTINTCPLQITGLTKLNLISCGLQSTECLKQLVSLQELYLGNNKEMNDITSLQYLTRLSKLSLNSCSLINLDALRPLKQLEELNISDNIVGSHFSIIFSWKLDLVKPYIIIICQSMLQYLIMFSLPYLSSFQICFTNYEIVLVIGLNNHTTYPWQPYYRVIMVQLVLILSNFKTRRVQLYLQVFEFLNNIFITQKIYLTNQTKLLFQRAPG
ncbi:leucine-rich_repeat domain-containing protein [Hexamita inflata]|uniref:Leucine-rich repeat domain-containing protein n=1 Tax=Hexamita inflata TaxID=28002 RepID=A0AA86NLI8_9EUKA|nr:leucine-rich repeat domain-containing protein [Hexamita inflata]